MITRAEFRKACEKAFKMMETAEIHLSETEPAKITVADFGKDVIIPQPSVIPACKLYLY